MSAREDYKWTDEAKNLKDGLPPNHKNESKEEPAKELKGKGRIDDILENHWDKKIFLSDAAALEIRRIARIYEKQFSQPAKELIEGKFNQKFVTAFMQMNRAIKCLALELHESIWNDVNDKWRNLTESIPAQQPEKSNEAIEALKLCKPFMDELQAENHTEIGAGIQYDFHLGRAYEEMQKVLSGNEAGERKFTLDEMLACWEAGANWYEDNEDYIRFDATVHPIDKKEYFKEKFGIDLGERK